VTDLADNVSDASAYAASVDISSLNDSALYCATCLPSERKLNSSHSIIISVI